ncbi:hypothetical protein Tco_0859377 [Tanacetum coccineum]|uniref:Uncharacterized protein n=1 Tax=Tanacetum coccineum TaxID=301880 RepID=A0ABQ5BBX3_9ASTR
MSSIIAQQTKLDLELVPKENRLDIGKCNGRILHGLTPREPTFQVVLDAIVLTPCYPAFLITADVPEICPRVPGRDFDALPSEEDTVSFLRELGHTREINSLNDVVVDQMHQPWRTFAALINRGLSGKTSGLDKLRLSRAQILWGIQNRRDLPRNTPLDKVEVLGMIKKISKVRMGIMRTETELALEQSQQGSAVSYESLGKAFKGVEDMIIEL